MTTRAKKTIEWIIFSFLGLIIVTAGLMFFYQLKYSNKIYKNITVAGIDLSGRSKLQAVTLLDQNFEDLLNKEIRIETQNKSVTTRVKDTGLNLDSKEIVEQGYGIGRNKNFFKQIYFSAETLWHKQALKVVADIDKDKYNNFIGIAVAQLNMDPKDASLAIENGQVVEVAEQDGWTVDTNNLTEKILELSHDNSIGVITLDVMKKPAAVKMADFSSAEQSAKAILDKKIILTYQNSTYTPNKGDIGNWIGFTNTNGQYTASLVDGNIKAYLNKIGRSFEIQAKDTKINALDDSVIEAGQDGLLLDKNDAVAQIKKQLGNSSIIVALNTTVVTSNQVKVIPAEGLVPGKFAGKYLDVDLTTQKLCRVDGTSVIDCYPISSGKPGMATPTGTYPISEKDTRHWSYKYKMWLPFWQRFIDEGYGIHELPETNTWKETAEHLGTPVSHGCVRLGVGPAETVYNWTEIGTPVYIHK